MEVKRVTLKKGREYTVLRRHPWIFSGALETKTKGLSDGDIVDVRTSAGEQVGVGYFANEGSIAVKMLAFGAVSFAETIFTDLIRRAVEVRRGLGLFCHSQTNAFRLVHGEGDSLPGLVVDLYGNTAVVQCQTRGMRQHIGAIGAALREVLGSALDAVYLRAGGEGEPGAEGRYLHGEPGERIITENGIRFEVDWERGQKTGFFLDQRENRALVRNYSVDRMVLNAFCYTGGFSLAAVFGGAKSVDSVDTSGAALAQLVRNYSLNEPSGAFSPQFVHREFDQDFLKFSESFPADYDLIVLDPPAFAKRAAAVDGALRGYKRINKVALSHILPGGILFTFSCSQWVKPDDFDSMLREAAFESGRTVRLLHRLHQAPCHAPSLFHPEGEYLKGLAVEVR